MRKTKLVRSPIEGEMRNEVLVERMRNELGAEQMLIVFTRGADVYQYRFGFCEHELMKIAQTLKEIAEAEGANEHDCV